MCTKLYKSKLTLILFSVCFIISIQASAESTSEKTTFQRPSVLLISIDGLKPQYIINAAKYSLNIPNIEALLKKSTFAQNGMTGITPTITFASHAAMLTGTNPIKNGIANNQASIVPQSDYNFFASDKVQNLWSAATEAGYITANLGIPVSIGANINYDVPTFWFKTTPLDIKYINQMCSPKNLVTQLSKKIGSYTYKLQNDNYLAGDIWKYKAAVYLLNHNIKKQIKETHSPLFMTMYFMDLDNEQHNNGIYSVRAKKSIEAIDRMVGNLIKVFKKTVGPNYIVNIVSDHGFANISKEIHINTALEKAGFITLSPDKKIKTWQAYACYAGGMCAILMKHPNNTKLLNKVNKYLSDFAQNPDNGVEKLFNKEELNKKGGFPKASFAMTAKPGYKFSGSFSDKIITKSSQKATHGYDPEYKEMRATYLISGINIPQDHKIHNMKLIDIAPTLAKLMGLNLQTAEGSALEFQK